MNDKDKDKNNDQGTHYTCTSTRLDQTPGSQAEHIDISALNKVHEQQTGTPISKNRVVALIQQEQAIARDKQNRGT
jgi:hypothetical protein